MEVEEENMTAMQNIIVSNIYTVYSGILITGGFTSDAIHCKLQSLLEHFYSSLCQLVVW